MSRTRSAVLRKVVQSAAALDQPAATDRELIRRFVRENDQSAFEALVNRHTAMVLGVCRRALSNVQDAEDACQATFLVLANQARNGRWQESVANWLYTTARKVAHNARVAAERRTRRETGAAVPEAVEPVDRMTGRELLVALDTALDGLPARYREPLVLCYLEGLTRDEAAARLGVPLATLHTRIDRARKKLHAALTKAGCALGAGLLALAVSSPAGASPPRLVASILATASGRAPAAVGELAKGVAVNGSFSKVVLAVAAVVVALGAGLGALKTSAAGQPTRAEANVASAEADVRAGVVPDGPAAAPAKEGEPLPEKSTYQGRVVGPDGKPVKGAQVFLYTYSPVPQQLVVRAKTDDEGRFSFEVKRSEFDPRSYELSPAPWQFGHLIASAPGFGVAWTEQGFGPNKDAELKLVADDAPVEGRLLNLQGEPVVGANARVLWALRSLNGDLAAWQAGLKRIKEQDSQLTLQGLVGLIIPAQRRHGLDPAVPSVVTGKDGRFALKGLGRDRVALVRIEGDGIESRDVFVVSRPGETKTVDTFVNEGRMFVPGQKANPKDVFLFTKFELTVAPCRLVTGTVTDVDTGKPVAGAVVSSDQFPSGVVDRSRAWTLTDVEGRYALRGLPVEKGCTVHVEAPAGEPYLNITAEVPDRAGLEPIKLDLRIKRGVWLTGNVLDRETKKPVQAMIRYAAEVDNPHLKAVPGFTMNPNVRSRGDDGGFRVPIMPGKGYLSVGVAQANNSRYGVGGDVPDGLPEFIPARPFTIGTKQINALVPLNPAADAKEVRQEVLLTPGRSVVVTILGPDGEKLKGVTASTDRYGRAADKLNDDGTLTVSGISAKRAKYVQAVCPDKKLAGLLKVTGEDKTATLKLQPWLSMKGRVVDEDGKPVEGAELSFQSVFLTPDDESLTGFWYKGTIKTGKDGTYQFEGLVPGSPYHLFLNVKGRMPQVSAFRADWKADTVRDLGDWKPAP
jgi:RNA polymerase sigma factor (sigma-70 family)